MLVVLTVVAFAAWRVRRLMTGRRAIQSGAS
jgi:flagellar biogenesis protein FliO